MFNIIKKVYLDHAASTPMRKEVIEFLKNIPNNELYGNSMSVHQLGQKNKKIIEDSRESIASIINCLPEEIVFTSGATESNNLAIKGIFLSRKQGQYSPYQILLSKIEHPSVIQSAKWLEKKENAKLIWIPVNQEGFIDISFIHDFLIENYKRVALITIQSSNSEIGTVQPIQKISNLINNFKIPFHSDIVQSFSNLKINFKSLKLSSFSISGHKIGGLSGSGLLVLKEDVGILPLHHGGGQELNIRSGSLDIYSICTLSIAIESVKKNIDHEIKKNIFLSKKLIKGMRQIVPNIKLNGPEIDDNCSRRLANNINCSFPGCNNEVLLYLFDSFNLYTSYGSACSSGKKRISYVLRSIGLDDIRAISAQRFTLGHNSSDEDINYFLKILPEIYQKGTLIGI